MRLRRRILPHICRYFAMVSAVLFVFFTPSALGYHAELPALFRVLVNVLFWMAVVVGLRLVFGMFNNLSYADRFDLEEEYNAGERPLVIYLRAFSLDQSRDGREIQHAEPRHFFSLYNLFVLSPEFEEKLLLTTDYIGTMIAISNPRNRFHSFAVLRIPIDEVDWKFTVSELIRRAELIIIRADVGDGLTYEIDEIVQADALNKVIWYFEFFGGEDRIVRRARYQRFVEHLSEKVGIRLPTSHEFGRYVYTERAQTGRQRFRAATSFAEACSAAGYAVEPNPFRTYLKASLPRASWLSSPKRMLNLRNRAAKALFVVFVCTLVFIALFLGDLRYEAYNLLSGRLSESFWYFPFILAIQVAMIALSVSLITRIMGALGVTRPALQLFAGFVFCACLHSSYTFSWFEAFASADDPSLLADQIYRLPFFMPNHVFGVYRELRMIGLPDWVISASAINFSVFTVSVYIIPVLCWIYGLSDAEHKFLTGDSARSV